jgi:hypothetical protein
MCNIIGRTKMMNNVNGFDTGTDLDAKKMIQRFLIEHLIDLQIPALLLDVGPTSFVHS